MRIEERDGGDRRGYMILEVPLRISEGGDV